MARSIEARASEKSTKSDDLPPELASAWRRMRLRGAEEAAAPSSALCVVYARFSDPAQKEASIDRQLEVCKAYAVQMNYELRADHLFADRGITGDSLDDRPALQEIRHLAAQGGFGKLLLYGWDRLSRRSAHGLLLFEEFKALGIEIHVAAGSATGLVDHIKAIFLSLCAMEERERLLRTTSYATWAAAETGANMAGIPYGFKKGAKRGEIVVHDEEMAVVVRIFTLFVVHRIPPMKIAHILNDDSVEAPRGGRWSAVTIVGSATRGGGILRNPKYIGWMIYGRLMTVRTPGRAKTILRVRSSKYWTVVERSELAFVDPKLWSDANILLEAMAEARADRPSERRSKSVLIFHGSYRCVCGSRMMLGGQGQSGARRLTCRVAIECGSCDRTASTSSHTVELEVLREIRDSILSEQAVALFEDRYVAGLKRAHEAALAAEELLTQRIEEIDRWFDASFDRSMMAGMTNSQQMRQRERLNLERERLVTELEEIPEPSRMIDMTAVDIPAIREAMDELIIAMPIMEPNEADLKLIHALRGLVRRVVVDRAPGRKGYTLQIDASLAGLAARVGEDAAEVGIETFVRDCADPRKKSVRKPELLERIARQVAANEFCTSDEDWAEVSVDWMRWDHPKKRLILDATLFYLRCGIFNLRSLPSPFDDRSIPHGVCTMIANGCWGEALTAMERIGSPTVAGLDTQRLAAKVKRFGPKS